MDSHPADANERADAYHADALAACPPDLSGRLPPGGECREALDTLYHYLDGELTDQRRSQIQHHLDECSPCLEAFDFEAELKMVVAKRCREQVPDALRTRVAKALQEASKTFPGAE
ncbi:MAG: mycothiol system anti-sigma-R factor [Actinomycetota bacterium]|nr:mycothiol system anti-sigma-R factor [Actinomycetota bacterium]